VVVVVERINSSRQICNASFLQQQGEQSEQSTR